jgi:hypothetical protein
VYYSDIDAGWHSKNAGSNWLIQNEELLQDSNSGSATRAGQVFSADDLNGTGWFLNFDLGGVPGTLTRVQLYGGLDDGNNSAGASVLGFGGDDAPTGNIVQGGAWTTLVDEQGLAPGQRSFSIAEDLSNFDLMAVRFRGTGATVGSTIDNVELSTTAPPPPPPPAQGLINGDFTDPTFVRSGTATYGDLGEGWVAKNAGTDWAIQNEELVQIGNSGSATRAGQLFRADEMTGTGWSLEFDLTEDDLPQVQVFAAVDDGNNLITQSVLSMGGDGPPDSGVTVDGWTTLIDEPNLAIGSHSFPIVEDLSDFNLIAIRFRGNGGSIDATLDNVRFSSSAAAIPEPSTFALAALGLLGLGFVGRRRRK